jgi:hypothetical protein
LIEDQEGDHLAKKDLKSHLKKRVKEANFQLINQLLTDLVEAVVVLEGVEEAVDVEWAEEMDLILVANVNLTGIVEVIDRKS